MGTMKGDGLTDSQRCKHCRRRWRQEGGVCRQCARELGVNNARPYRIPGKVYEAEPEPQRAIPKTRTRIVVVDGQVFEAVTP